MSKPWYKNLSAVKNVLPHFLVKEVSLSNDEGWQSIFGATDPGLAGSISDRNLMGNDRNWVYVSVDKIAEALANSSYKLMKFKKDDEDEEVFDHPLLDVLDKPNNMMSGADLMYHTAAHLELTGNAYWLHDDRNPRQLLALLPHHTKIKMSDGLMDIRGYEYRVGTFVQQYNVEQILHHKYPNPKNPLKGRGTLANIAEWVDVDSFATEFNRKFFINGGVVGGVLHTQATTQDALNLAKEAWESRHQGASNSHKTSVLPKDITYEEAKRTQKDMEFNQSLITTRNNILAAFGVPKSVVGISETGDSKSDAEAAHFAFMFFTVKPKITRLERFLNENFIPLFDNAEDLYIKFDDPVPENKEARLNEKKTELAGQAWKTVNEIRGEEGLPELEGGDELKTQGGIVLSLDKTKANGKSKTKDVPFRRLMIKKSQQEKKDDAKDSLVDKALSAVVKANEDTQEEIEEAQHKEFADRTERKVEKLAGNFVDHDQQLKEKILAELEEVQNPEEIKLFIAKGLGDNLIDRKAAVEATIEFTDPVLQDIVRTEGAERFNEVEGAAGAFDPDHKRIQGILKKNLKLMAESYTDTTIKILEKKLTEAIENGDSMTEIRDTVAEVFDFTESYRAARVAHTEVFRTANAAGREAFKQSGVVTAVRWHTAADERVCPFCNPMNGKIVSVDEGFFKKGDQLVGDNGKVLNIEYSDVMDPPLHSNCRCFTLPEDIDIGEASGEAAAEHKHGPDCDHGHEDEESAFLKEAISILEHGEKST